jgi:predicted CopG family antitoxin
VARYRKEDLTMSTKNRPSALDAIKMAAQTATPKADARQATDEYRTEPATPGPTKGDTLTTAIHIRRDHWELLRRAAFNRAMSQGGRASVSAVLTEMIERHRDELEAEAKD